MRYQVFNFSYKLAQVCFGQTLRWTGQIKKINNVMIWDVNVQLYTQQAYMAPHKYEMRFSNKQQLAFILMARLIYP